MALTAAQEGKYTFGFGGSSEALWFDVSYDTVSNRWSVVMKKGSMDLNALWWSNNNSTQEIAINLNKSDNSLNMNGTGVVWDGYEKISDTGLLGKEHNGSSLLTAGNTYTYAYTTSQGVDFEALISGGSVTLGVRATSVNGSGGIKEVNTGWDSFTPNTPVNVAPVAVNDLGVATEAGGINNGTFGSDAAGNVLTNDTDVDGPSKTVSAVRTGGTENSGTAGTVGAALIGTYGSLTLQDNGTYTYIIDNNNAAVQSLKVGTTLSESFNYTVSDGSLSDTAVLAITITGANDNASITVNGTPDTAVTEAGGQANGTPGDPSASGDLDVSDVDSGEAKFQTPASLAGTYGDFTFNANSGVWAYTLNDADSDTQALTAGQLATDSLLVKSFDGTASQTIQVTITGANDNASITVNGTPDTAVTEAGGSGNGTPGDPSASGDLDVSDVDSGEAKFQTPASLAGTYGDFTFNANSGVWTYTLNDADSDTQALTAGQLATDSLLVKSFDGTASQTIQVSITGANDNASITVNGTPDAAVTEAGGQANGTPGDPSASGDLDVSDVDSGEAKFQTPASLAGTYGDFTFNANSGVWAYTLNDADSDTQALTAGQLATDSLLVKSFDGTASQTIQVSITGANDNASITVNGTPDAAVTEAGGQANGTPGDPSASGDLDVSDVDSGEAKFQTPASLAGTYGDFSFNANSGVWAYTLNDADSDTQALTAGQLATDSLLVKSFDGTASQTIQVTITGANDNASITVNGTPDTAVTEAGGSENGTPGDPSASGDLDVSDVDSGEAKFQTPASLAGTYGDFSFNANSGVWAYTLNDADSDTQALTAGQLATDSLLVKSFDGTASQTIQVTITGAGDAPVAVADQWTLSDTALPAGMITPNWFLWNDTDAETQGSLYVTDVTGLSGTGLTADYDSANQNRFIGFRGTPTTPAGAATQTDYTLGYTLNDGQGGTASGTINLRIQGTTAAGNAVTIDQIGNDYSYIDLQDGADTITGENDTVAGSAGIDYIVGGQGADSIFGEGGTDTIDGGAGIDTLSGGDDDDTFNVVNATDSASDTIDGGSGMQDRIVISTGTAFSLGTDAQVVNVEIIEATGTSGVNAANQTENLTIRGSATSDAGLIGGSGNDTITKTVSSASTRGSAFGGFGNDTITWTVAAGVTPNTNLNWLRGGAGNDTITLNMNGGNLTGMVIAGNAGTTANLAGYNSFNPADTFTDDDTVILNGSVGTSVNGRVHLNSGNDTFISNLTAGTIAVHGGAGNDSLIGGAGADNSTLQGIANSGLVGGDGNDTLVGRGGADILDGDGGNSTLDADIDTVDYSQDGGTGAVNVNLSTGIATDSWGATDTLKSIENLIGTALADTITGSAAANVLSGGNGDDSILGEAGDDTLVGGLGADNLTGGIGINVFRYNAINEGSDSITDFASGTDKLSFSTSAFDSITSATLNSNFFIRADSVAQNGTTPQFIFNTASQALIYDANGTNPDGQSTLLTVQLGASIVANDLVFF